MIGKERENFYRSTGLRSEKGQGSAGLLEQPRNACQRLFLPKKPSSNATCTRRIISLDVANLVLPVIFLVTACTEAL